MARDTSPRRTPRRLTAKSSRKGSGVITGLLIGLALGAVLAAGSAWLLTRTSPFQTPQQVAAPVGNGGEPVALPGKPGDRPVTANRDFDFYTVLPQGEGAAQAPAPATTPTGQPAPRTDRLYLQVGAFEDPAEADNMKALLALNGIEAVAQRATLDDGRIVHRVRVGPFARPEDMTSVRSRLAAAGVSGNVVQANP
ncbi:MAG: SPOR domain-containing protein [Pseudazoarcus pumilus]|nr:SPOR domain-containing protein [Pseudazoarcus pumilus]